MCVIKYFHSSLIAVIIIVASSLYYAIEITPNSKKFKICDAVYVVNLDRSKDRLEHMSRELVRVNLPFIRFSAVDGNKLIFTNLSTNKTISGEEIKKDPDFFVNTSAKFIVSYAGLEHLAFEFDNTNPIKHRKITTFYCSERDPKYFHMTCLGELGCAYSHIGIMEEIVKNNYKKTIIFEDDIYMKKHFKKKIIKLLKNIPDDADIVYIDANSIDEKTLEPVVDNKYVYAINTIVCTTHAYIVTLNGAKKILQSAKKIDNTIDFHISNLASQGLKMYISSKKIVQSDVWRQKFESTIVNSGMMLWEINTSQR